MVVAGVLAGTLTVGGAVVLSDGGDGNADEERGERVERSEPTEAAERAARVELVTAPKDLVFALQAERSAALATVGGVAGIVEMPAGADMGTRRWTDTAIASFQAATAEGTETGESPYQEALDVLVGLGALRDEIDGRAHSGPSELAGAFEVYDRYSVVILAVLDAHAGVVSSTDDDPELRLGAPLFETALRQVELTAQLVTELVRDPDAQGTSHWVTDIARRGAELERGRRSVMEHADGAYAEAAGQLDAELEATGSLGSLDEMLTTGQGAELMDALESTSDSWLTFLDRVEATLIRAG